MLDPAHLTVLLPRAEEGSAADACATGNEYDGRMGLRVSAVFVILVGSSLGALFPVWARPGAVRDGKRRMNVPPWAFFVAKYFGSGVIVATAFIHLLAPAHEALSNPCLTGPITEYPWVEGIMLMTIVLLFFIELMVIRFARFGDADIAREIEDGSYKHDQPHSHSHNHSHGNDNVLCTTLVHSHTHDHQCEISSIHSEHRTHVPSEDHSGHSRDLPSDISSNNHCHTPAADEKPSPHNHVHGHDHHHHHHHHGHTLSSLVEDYSAQLTSIFILEFGIIFHSIFIGLTLAVAGEEFITLYVVLVFHQTFEGLGLGSRLATVPWPRSKRLTPYMLAIVFGLSTPISIAIGLGVRESYPPEGRTTLIVNGVFDSISAGILIYTALVELMAHEFMFSPSMRRAPIRKVLAAFGLLCLGAALMALLGKWA
ncbi:membrane zinc transporter [Blastomyces dermatitidis ER-3]|uniref:Membrane zinc transporter n=2 Tax=Ajellomyces dermatitidis TaxID=5039 RepID=F2TSN7_AJEDA|nr:membrane zinc transporter [Blastomyces dermatitidis ER-3]EEQ92299.1 membrane zinc transporter [Blastomyces dermatitidis ER-3]EGE86250.1 membrane zinc transporter [Blastomyces dermatitidis ATCC 18188]